jgi:hypothetical protein
LTGRCGRGKKACPGSRALSLRPLCQTLKKQDPTQCLSHPGIDLSRGWSFPHCLIAAGFVWGWGRGGQGGPGFRRSRPTFWVWLQPRRAPASGAEGRARRRRRRGGGFPPQTDGACTCPVCRRASIHRPLPRCPRRETARPPSCKTHVGFMACDNRCPPRHATLHSRNILLTLLFAHPLPLRAVISCTTINRFLIDLFKMQDTAGCTQLSHITCLEPRVQLGSL